MYQYEFGRKERIMKPLKVNSLGIHSCLAYGAPLTAAAMRCGYDGFGGTSFTQPYVLKKQLGATIDTKSNARGLTKLIGLCKEVVQEIAQSQNIDFGKVPLYICLQDIDRPSAFSMENIGVR